MTDKQAADEHMSAIRTDIARMAEHMDTFTIEMRATRQIVAGMAALQDRDHVEVALIKKRLDRLERRLDASK
ncbi:MAG: hypothetical protein AAGA89_00410 [Pseudomonadota bacterium]